MSELSSSDTPAFLRRKARKLLKAAREGKPEALGQIGHQGVSETPLKLAQVLHALARQAGHESWPKLVFAHEAAGMDRSARAERLKIALYLGQFWAVEHLLTQDPSLEDENFGLLVSLYRREMVEAQLLRDPDAATRIVGIRNPIMHLAFSRWHRAPRQSPEASVALADLLIANGADVNDSYPSEPGSKHRLSALYGAIGHAGNVPLARRLLELGADPNDHESLYHATELGHTEGVELLLAYGAKTDSTNALLRAMDFDNIDMVRMLLAAGADPNEGPAQHPSGQPNVVIPGLHQAARRRCSPEIAELLIAHGADGKRPYQGHSAYALARMYGNSGVADVLQRHGQATPLDPVEEALARCADGEVPQGRPLSGLDPKSEAGRALTRVILWEDSLDHAKRLVEAGIDPDTTEEMGMPPIHLAGWAGLVAQTEWLLGLEPDFAHVNDYGGDLVSTIIHGSENRLDTDKRDHVACLCLALEAGAPLKAEEVRGAMNERVVAFLSAWAEMHPHRIVDERNVKGVPE